MTSSSAGQRHVLVQRQHDAADAHDRRGDHQREGQQHQHLDLLHVVGGAGDQRRRAELAHLAGGELLHPAKIAAADVAADAPSPYGRRSTPRAIGRRSAPA